MTRFLDNVIHRRKMSRRSLEKRVPGLLNSDAFRAELVREKLRADRTLTPFTLILFDVLHSNDHDGIHEKFLELLGRIAKDASRASDTKGWYRNGKSLQVGLILNDTPPDRSQRVIQQVRSHFRDKIANSYFWNGKAAEVSCKIWSYPNGDLQRPWPDPDRSSDRRQDSVKVFLDGNLLSHQLPAWKRGIDIVGASIGLAVLSPIFLIAGAFIKIVSPGPVFYKQTRLGYLGKPFTMWKLRTMKVNTSASVHERYVISLIRGAKSSQSSDRPMVKLDKENDTRIIPVVGKLLRKTYLDELPQLINVFRGEMSLVGPRPCIPYEAEEYLHWHTRRMDSVPGMTGLWQVSGKNDIGFKDMVRLDITYSTRMSFWLDLKILLLTPLAIAAEMKKGLLAWRRTAVEAT